MEWVQLILKFVNNPVVAGILAIIGIALTIYFGVKVTNRKMSSQVQKTGANSVAIQSGRDTTIGEKDD